MRIIKKVKKCDYTSSDGDASENASNPSHSGSDSSGFLTSTISGAGLISGEGLSSLSGFLAENQNTKNSLGNRKMSKS